MNNLIKEFKSLRTPQRADLISQMVYIHTKMLKSKDSNVENESNFCHGYSQIFSSYHHKFVFHCLE